MSTDVYKTLKKLFYISILPAPHMCNALGCQKRASDPLEVAFHPCGCWEMPTVP